MYSPDNALDPQKQAGSRRTGSVSMLRTMFKS
jgi:hypothetical protein